MAVYEQSYQPFTGALTPARTRFLLIPRYAYRSVFQSKLFVAFFAACFIYPLAAAILIYLKHNLAALTMLQQSVGQLVAIDGDFFYNFMLGQGALAFFLTVLVGPPLMAQDLANNALPLYLARPFSRAEYLLGKASVLLILLSLITWIPGLVLFGFQAYLDGGSWLSNSWWIALALFGGSWAWLTCLTLLALTVSSLLRWRTVASGALVALMFVPMAFGEIINNLFQTRMGHLLSFNALIRAVWSGLFRNFVVQTGHIRVENRGRVVYEVFLNEPPLWASWLVLSLVCMVCVWLLARRVRAYEIVK